MMNIRRNLLAAAFLLLAAFSLDAAMKTDRQTGGTDAGGHVLSQLWADYGKASAADRPKRQQEILRSIMDRARQDRLGWDYYDAWNRYVSVSSSRDWKQRQTLQEECAKAFEEYGDPLLTYAWRSGRYAWEKASRLPFIRENAEVLKASCSKSFHLFCGNTPSMMNGLLGQYIGNDYEYALWDYLGNGRPDKEASALLRAELKGAYPASAYLDYIEAEALDIRKRTEAMEKVKADYEGKAVGMMAWASLLGDRMWKLEEADAASAEYEALYAEAREFERRRKAIRGEDRALAASITEVRNLIDRLTEKDVQLGVEGEKISIYLRNLPSVTMCIYADEGEKLLFRRKMVNESGSFYREDTLGVAFPLQDDGAYRIRAVSGRASAETRVEKHSLSLALRRDRDAFRIYLAWQDSGAPVEKAELVLRRNGREVSVVQDFEFDGGFTALPPELSSFLTGDGRYSIECRFRDADGVLRKSKALLTDGKEGYSSSGARSQTYGRLYTDRMAYRPGETVSFNALYYKGDLRESISTACQGLEAKAVLIDAEGNEIGSEVLKINDFGTAASAFELPKGRRNGWFNIVVTAGGCTASRSFRVDDFRLPDSELVFDRDEQWYMPGDVVSVGGIIRTYSGHSTDAFRLDYQVDYKGEKLISGHLAPDAGGHFSLEFPTGDDVDWQYYRVTVRVVDGNGQTQEYGRSVNVSRSFSLDLSLVDGIRANYEKPGAEWSRGQGGVIDTDRLRIRVGANAGGGVAVNPVVDYVLCGKDGGELLSGRCSPGEALELDLSAYSGSFFTLKAKGRVRGIEAEAELEFARVRPGDKVLDAPFENYFSAPSEELGPGEDIVLRMGAADGPVWAVVEIFGADSRLLSTSSVHLDGRMGEAGSLVTLTLPYPDEYPDAVRLQVFYFRKGRSHSFDVQYSRRREVTALPLEWSRLVDRTVPGSRVTLGLKTLPEAEVMATVYDLSVDRICPYDWDGIRLSGYGAPSVRIRSVCGGMDSGMVIGYGAARPSLMSRKSLSLSRASVVDVEVEEDMALAGDVLQQSVGNSAGAVVDEVRVREDFAGTLAFEPSLRSDGDGNVSLSFEAADRLSTYKVMAFAHTKDMRNSVLKGEFLVTLPLQLGFNPPAYVHVGDRPSFSVTLSSSADELLRGTLYLYGYAGARHEGEEPLSVQSRRVELPARSSVAVVLDPGSFDEVGERGFKLVFVADGKDGFSDAMFVSIPVLSDAQILTESHSALMTDSRDREALLAELSAAFVNTTPYGALVKETSIRDMLTESFASRRYPSVPDVISLSEALYVRLLADKLGLEVSPELSVAKLLEDLLACQNADGGFSWFSGMESSPVMTAAVLERMAKLSRHADVGFDPHSAVAYLDRAYFSRSRQLWNGGISMEQYLYVRSAYSEIPFEYEPVGEKAREEFRAFGKDAADYLLPVRERGLSGQILAKARRLRTLAWLSADGAETLVSALGIRRSSQGKLDASLEKDVASLLEYAVDHRDGAVYYPDAVMPFRGLLESEAYAHSLLCDLFEDYADGFGAGAASGEKAAEAERVADGIRLWLMLQKETQHWDADASYLDAVNSVLSGNVMDVRVLVMSKSFQKPYSQIKPSGNGLRIERKFLKDGKEIAEGEQLRPGDKITAEYRVWNAENRSFVRLKAYREAAFRPVDQLSGLSRWGVFRAPSWPVSYGGCYRNVLPDLTEYYFDSYPEEDSVITEEYFVTQEGSFSAPVLEIECLYAPHYRANSGFGGTVTSRR